MEQESQDSIELTTLREQISRGLLSRWIGPPTQVALFVAMNNALVVSEVVRVGLVHRANPDEFANWYAED